MGACACPAGLTVCSGACVDPLRDDRHCGGCDRPCPAGAWCVDGACAACTTAVSFAADVQPVFTASCQGSSCHQAPAPAVGLDLSRGLARAQLVNVPAMGCASLRVAPRAPADSVLVRAVVGSGCAGVPPMPLDLPPLPSSQIDRIRAWICEGAPDN
jgi:hypothetical protein